MTRAERLKLYQAYHNVHHAEFQRWRESGYRHDQKPEYRPIPDYVINMRCEATTRAGTPCKRKDIYRNGRCKYHGGESTGAKTEEGKARQLEGYRRWLAKKKVAKCVVASEVATEKHS